MTDHFLPQIAYHKDTGEIVRISIPVGNEPWDGEMFEDLYVHRVYDLEGLDPATFLSTRRWDFDNSQWVECPRKPNAYAFWDTANGVWDWDKKAFKDEVRHFRNTLLSASDWTQIDDATLSNEQRAEARAYRQELRDVLQNLPEDTDEMQKVVWPTRPSFL